MPGLLLLLGSTGCQGPFTGVVLTVLTDMKVPDELNQVTLTVSTPGDTGTTLPYTLGVDGGPELPGTFAIYADTAVQVSIVLKGEGPIGTVTRKARLTLVQDQVLALSLALVKDCVGDPCKNPNLTCIEGKECVSQDVPPGDLTMFDPNNPTASVECGTYVDSATHQTVQGGTCQRGFQCVGGQCVPTIDGGMPAGGGDGGDAGDLGEGRDLPEDLRADVPADVPHDAPVDRRGDMPRDVPGDPPGDIPVDNPADMRPDGPPPFDGPSFEPPPFDGPPPRDMTSFGVDFPNDAPNLPDGTADRPEVPNDAPTCIAPCDQGLPCSAGLVCNTATLCCVPQPACTTAGGGTGISCDVNRICQGDSQFCNAHCCFHEPCTSCYMFGCSGFPGQECIEGGTCCGPGPSCAPAMACDFWNPCQPGQRCRNNCCEGGSACIACMPLMPNGCGAGIPCPGNGCCP
jgi:hypothetical protein